MDQTRDAVMSIVITNRTGDLGGATARESRTIRLRPPPLP